jgi:hypothetical protein
MSRKGLYFLGVFAIAVLLAVPLAVWARRRASQTSGSALGHRRRPALMR